MTTDATPRPKTWTRSDVYEIGPYWAYRKEALAIVEERDTLRAQLAETSQREVRVTLLSEELQGRAEAAEARAKRLEKALSAIVTRYDTTHVSAMELVGIAHAALAAKEGE